MISFAGIQLLHPDPALVEWAKANIDPSWSPAWTERTEPGSVHDGGDVSGWRHKGFAGMAPAGPIVPGRLVWPTGARRFAYGHFLASDNQVDAIRQNLNVSGTLSTGTLVLSDGKRSISTSMWMLPVRPLQQVESANGLNLLTLVDDRWFWWMRSGDITVTGGTTVWTDLYSAIASALGVGISVDSIPGAYLKPGQGLTARYDAIPLLLDTVAASTGLRIVRGLDGSVSAQSVNTATSSQDGNLDLDPGLAGGLYDLDDSDTPNDISSGLPASVKVVFPKLLGNGTATDVYTVNVSTPGGATNSTKYLFSDAIARIPNSGGSAPTNSSELTALANQIASDWYSWMVSGVADVRLSGFQPWAPSGLDDVVEWEQVGERMSTRARRMGWREHLNDLSHYGTYGSAYLIPRPALFGQLEGNDGSRNYDWTQVEFAAGVWSAVANGFTGTTTEFPARAISSTSTLASGTVVWMELSADGLTWLFSHPWELMYIQLTATDCGGHYTWHQVDYVSGSWVAVSGGLSGENTAIEADGNACVAIPSIQVATPVQETGFWTFRDGAIANNGCSQCSATTRTITVVSNICPILTDDGYPDPVSLSTGSLLVGTGTSTVVQLPPGSNGTLLQMQSGLPAWTNTLDAGTF